MRDAFWRFREAILFILRDMVQDGWRTIVTILNLFIFLCCYFCLAALADASNEYGRQQENESAVIVMSKGVLNPGDSNITEADFIPLNTTVSGRVKTVSPLIFKLVKVDEFLIQVCGAKRDEFTTVFGLSLKEGSWPNKADEVLVSEGTILLTKWRIGQTIIIYGKPFRIIGEVSTSGTRTSSIWMPMEVAEALFGTRGVYQFAWIIAADNSSGEQIRSLLQSNPKISTRFDVVFVDALYQQYSQALQGIKDLSIVLVGFALVMVTFGTYGSVYLTLSERGREIAILRAIGFSTMTIREVLTLRSVLQAGIAFLTAWGFSAFLLTRFNSISPLTINSLPLLVEIDGKIWLMGFALALFFCCLGVWMPTIRLHYSTVHESIQR